MTLQRQIDLKDIDARFWATIKEERKTFFKNKAVQKPAQPVNLMI